MKVMKARQQITLSRRIFYTLILLALLAVSFFVSFSIVRHTIPDLRLYSWNTSEAIITAVRESCDRYGYRVNVEYTRQVQRAEIKSEETVLPGTLDYMRYEAILNNFKEGSRVPCFVDPHDEAHSALQRFFPWRVIFFPLPLAFGVLMLVALSKLWQKRAQEEPEHEEETISGPAASSDGTSWYRGLTAPVRSTLGISFYSFLLLLVAFLAFNHYVQSFLTLVEGQFWLKVPCEILASRLDVSSDGEGTTYTVIILYRYEYGGKRYISNRYAFTGGMPGGKGNKKAIVDACPAETRTHCFIDPGRPYRAVLVNRGSPEWPFGGLFIGFMVALCTVLRKELQRRVIHMDLAPEGPVRKVSLRTSSYRSLSVFAWAAASCIWGYPLLAAAQKLSRLPAFGGERVAYMMFLQGLLPELMVEFVFLALTLYYAAALWAPRVALCISSYPVVPGVGSDVEWTLIGDGKKLQNLEITLEGREEATSTEGSTTRTDREVFHTALLLQSMGLPILQQGKGRIQLSALAMPSFQAAHNRIVWSLKIRGHLRVLPAIDEEFEMAVIPPRPRRS
jgi:hypothetical protein